MTFYNKKNKTFVLYLKFFGVRRFDDFENKLVNTQKVLLQANFSLAFRSNLTFCPSKRSFNMTIYHEGLDDRVEIEVEHECQCDCQRKPEAVSIYLRWNHITLRGSIFMG